jgi:hypothetical protein
VCRLDVLEQLLGSCVQCRATSRRAHPCERVAAHSVQTGRQADLLAHTQEHNGDRPHWCPYCTYRTAYKCDVTSHMRIHTGEKPYRYRITRTSIESLRPSLGEACFCHSLTRCFDAYPAAMHMPLDLHASDLGKFEPHWSVFILILDVKCATIAQPKRHTSKDT